MLCTTLALAIQEVAESINCELEIAKIKRCSNVQASAADAISKAEWRRFRQLMPGATPEPAKVPLTLLCWVQNHVEDCTLGEKILREMGVRRDILGLKKRFI